MCWHARKGLMNDDDGDCEDDDDDDDEEEEEEEEDPISCHIDDMAAISLIHLLKPPNKDNKNF